jgi:hypothetical protein
MMAGLPFAAPLIKQHFNLMSELNQIN